MIRFAPRSILVVSLVLGSSLVLGCSDVGTLSLEIAGSPEVTAGLTTADGWTVGFDQFVVVVHDPGMIERSDNKPTWVREFGVTVWDVTEAVGEGDALSSMIRATRYDGADFRIAPASTNGYAAASGNVDDAIVDAAVADDWAVHVVGTATKTGSPSLSFDWTFTSTSMYRCKFEGDEVVELGAEGDETTVLEILGEELLRASADTEPSFDAIAAADGDGDGTLSQAELESAGVWDAIEAGSVRLGGHAGSSCPLVEP